jgi:hypothetical protein
MEFIVHLTLIKCSPVEGQSRLERRRLSASVAVPARLSVVASPAVCDLGTFEGERKRRCSGYDESYGVTKAMLSLLAVTAFMFVVAVTVGAV